jgi:DGQHR domain-containing protein
MRFLPQDVKGRRSVDIVIPAKELVKVSEFLRFEIEKGYESAKQGCQRQLIPALVQNIEDYLKSHPKPAVQQVTLGDINHSITISESNLLTIDGNKKLVSLDGQQRSEAISRMIAEDPAFGDVPISAKVYLDLTLPEARELFLIFNVDRRQPKATIKNNLLITQAITGGNDYDLRTHSPQKQRTLIAQMAIGRLFLDNSSIWYHRPDARDTGKGIVALAELAFSTNRLVYFLEQINQVRVDSSMDVQAKVVGTIFENYWKAISQVCPGMTGESYLDYLLMGLHSRTMTMLLPDICYMLTRLEKPITVENFVTVLQTSDTLKDENKWRRKSGELKNFRGYTGILGVAHIIWKELHFVENKHKKLWKPDRFAFRQIKNIRTRIRPNTCQ